MTSAIDPTKPTTGTATTESVRQNFSTAKTEIEDLQAAIISETINRNAAIADEVTARNTAIDDAIAQEVIDRNAAIAEAKPAFSVYKASSQTGIANTTFTLVTWDVEEFDTNNSFASNRFTPKAAGNYLLNAHLMWNTGVDQSAYLINIYKNGSLYKSTRDSFSGSTDTAGNAPCNQITEIVKANGTTDYFEIYVWHGAGSSQTLNGDSINSVFSGVLL